MTDELVRRLARAACAAAIVLSPAAALAGGQLYLLSQEGPFWPDGTFPVPYNINPGTAAANIQGANPTQQFIDATVAAFGTWEALPTSRITFQRGPDSALLLDSNPNDGVNLMVFNNVAIVQGIPFPLPAGVLAVTNTFFDANTGIISGGSITFNTNPIPDLPAPHYSTTGAPGTLDVEAIMLHEAGHFQGLAHSVVRNDVGGDLAGGPSNAAVMFPFISPDVLDGRVPDDDDVAWHGFIYPSASFGTTLGTITGTAERGTGCGGGANGVHVVARRQDQPVGGEARMVVGTYSYTADGADGPFTIPGLPPGNYQVWAEPLDGSPVAALQINSRIQFTAFTQFPEDWYSGVAETGNEADPGDPGSAVTVTVSAGGTVSGIRLLLDAVPVNMAAVYATPFVFAFVRRRMRRA